MYSIINSDASPHHLPLLRKWFLEKWGRVDPFDFALLAVDGEKLAGGLVFTTYPVSDDEERGLWINALYIVPEYRGEGIGSALIIEAETEALRMGYKELFVFTDIPRLYLKSGWLLIDDSARDKVFKKKLL